MMTSGFRFLRAWQTPLADCMGDVGVGLKYRGGVTLLKITTRLFLLKCGEVHAKDDEEAGIKFHACRV